MKKITLLTVLLFSLAVFTACDTLNKLPTNTSGGIFSLNGNWKLTSSSDNNAEAGTVVTVTPALTIAYVRTLGTNNSYCYRTNDEAWKSISSLSAGGFSISYLAGACSGNPTYNAGQITVITNNHIRINTKTTGNIALTQEWDRVVN